MLHVSHFWNDEGDRGKEYQDNDSDDGDNNNEDNDDNDSEQRCGTVQSIELNAAQWRSNDGNGNGGGPMAATVTQYTAGGADGDGWRRQQRRGGDSGGEV